jgi:tRNA 5-methylaminomethyl-2-thiouridine biosynthesis bifunctional protein
MGGDDRKVNPDPIDWSDAAHPRSTRYGDVFASRAGALAQAEQVFLRGNGLPERWRGRDRFVILETGFGLGNNFLASWAAWRADPAASRRLFFLSLDAHPVAASDLARAHAHSPLAELARQLQAQWPPRVAGWHRLDFEGGRITLLLAVGDVREVLPQWQASVDAFFLDGFAPRLNPAMWSADTLAPLARLAAVGATAATWSAARGVRDALQAAGFLPERVAGFGGKAQMTVAHFVPPRAPPAPPGRLPLAPGAKEAIVLGAGLAGAACARALQQAGLAVRVIESATEPASGASGNPAGLFHATVHADDGPHARWNRQAALRCRQWLSDCPPPWQIDGLLRLSPGEALDQRRQLVDDQGLDPRFAQALDARQASAQAGLALDAGGWLFPGGGALPPRDWVLRLLAGLELQTGIEVAALQALPEGRWALLAADGSRIAETALLVLAAGSRLPALLAPLDPALAARLQAQRGQLSQWAEAPRRPALPLAAGGYALALPEAAGGGLLAGATATLDDDEAEPRAADDQHNAAVAERLLGLAPGSLPRPSASRVAWRLLAPDKLPLVGGLVDPAAPTPRRATQVAHWPRRPGLAVCGALASRGIGWAPLAAELLVAQALGEPLTVPRSLVDAVDPARWAARDARQA